MDKIKIEGERPPRYQLFISDAKYEPIGEAVCKSDNLDELRVFPRRADTRYVLYDRRERTPTSNLEVKTFADFRSPSVQGDGNGWHCKNPKCGMLIAAATALPTNETLVHITCPHCDHPGFYFLRDAGWKKSRAR